MIATLDGVVSETIDGQIILVCGGVGYGVWVTLEDGGRLHGGQPAKIYIYEHIREQSHDLFGFIDKSTKKLFELLLTVNGVGPKMALSVLSIAPVKEVQQAIVTGNVGVLKAAAGVGKRVAERIVVDLKDKIGVPSIDNQGVYINDIPSSADEAVDALISLGFSTLDAQNAVKNIDTDLPVEDRIKQALMNGRRT